MMTAGCDWVHFEEAPVVVSMVIQGCRGGDWVHFEAPAVVSMVTEGRQGMTGFTLRLPLRLQRNHFPVYWRRETVQSQATSECSANRRRL